MAWESAGGSQTFLAYNAIKWGTGATNRASEWPWYIEQVIYHGANSTSLNNVGGVRMVTNKSLSREGVNSSGIIGIMMDEKVYA